MKTRLIGYSDVARKFVLESALIKVLLNSKIKMGIDMANGKDESVIVEMTKP